MKKGGVVIFKNDHGINNMITGGEGGKNLDFFDHEIKVRPLSRAEKSTLWMCFDDHAPLVK